MIISASRRTDIPAFYAEWMLRRLRQGLVLVRNPMNFHQVSRLILSPQDVECLVFWTKNAAPMLEKLKEITALGYPYYFLFTLTPYDSSIEVKVPAVDDRIKTFQTLALQIGKERVLWRYDPILFTSRYSLHFHIEAFTALAADLAGYTETCIVSFVEMYRKCRKNLGNLELTPPSLAARIECLSRLRDIAAATGINLRTCAAGEELQATGMAAGKCIDDGLISKIGGRPIIARKDANQRAACRCVESIDIGAYDSCPHGCRYCYANNDLQTAMRNSAAHSPASPLLHGTLGNEDRITDRPLKSLRVKQQQLF